jgi:hypothetical protein
MKTKITILGTLVAFLTLSASAGASTRHFEGTFAGDDNATVSMNVVVRHGEPRRVRDLAVTDLDYSCTGGETGERSVTFAPTAVFESARDGLFEFQSELNDTGTYFVIGGLMRPSLRKVKGGLAYVFDGPSGTCESSAAGVGRFVAR